LTGSKLHTWWTR